VVGALGVVEVAVAADVVVVALGERRVVLLGVHRGLRNQLQEEALYHFAAHDPPLLD
jgi:hypothetical protein